MTPCKPSLFALALIPCLLVPAAAQDGLGVGPDRLERVAAAYGQARWPAPAAPRVGLDPETVCPDGWSQVRLERDARRAEAVATFAPARQALTVELAQLHVRRHDSAHDARAALLASLSLCQAQLERLEGPGDLAFGTPEGQLSYVAGTCGNLSFLVRSLKTGAELAPLLQSLDQALRAAPPCEPGATVPLPRVVAVELPPQASPRGAPTPLSLDLDPSGPEAVALSFECTAGASVLQTAEGFELYAAGPGPVVVTVYLATADLRTGQHRFKIQVPQ